MPWVVSHPAAAAATGKRARRYKGGFGSRVQTRKCHAVKPVKPLPSPLPPDHMRELIYGIIPDLGFDPDVPLKTKMLDDFDESVNLKKKPDWRPRGRTRT